MMKLLAAMHPWVLVGVGIMVCYFCERTMWWIQQRIEDKRAAVAHARWLRGHHGAARWTEMTPPRF